MNPYDLQRIDSFQFLNIYQLYLEKNQKGFHLNALSDGELLQVLFELEEAPTRKVITFIKRQSNGLTCSCDPKHLIHYLCQINKESYPQSKEQLAYLMAIMCQIDCFIIPCRKTLPCEAVLNVVK